MKYLKPILLPLLVLLLCLMACSPQTEPPGDLGGETDQGDPSTMGTERNEAVLAALPGISPGERAAVISRYTDTNGDIAVIPAGFTVSTKAGEGTVRTGVVVIGPDGSEFVWVPTTETALAVRDFGSYFYGSSLSGYRDETEQTLYQDMVKSVGTYGGFYMGWFEASCGGGTDVSSYVPASRRLARPWVQFSPQDSAIICQNLYADNDTVQGFFPWGINYDTTLQWLIDSGCKTKNEVTSNSTSWGNYSNDTFSQGADGSVTGQWEEASANNIYDLAGNNWEWTQERYGSGNYVMRGGGYNLMGGACRGSDYPAALRDPLPGNEHPNVTFRVALFVR